MSRRSSRTIYVGNLPADIRMREIEDLFMKYGPIVDIDLKIPPRPPGYAFIEFEDPRDADDAIYGRDGCNFDGYRLRVELAHGRRGHSSSADRYSSYSRSSSSRGASRRSDYRVLVTGLPSSASWQDLKDHMRQAGDVCFSQVFRDRGGMTGVVDYTNYDDMKYAIRKLDDSEFRNAFSRSYIRVEEYDSSRGYSRSPSYDSGQSYSRSPSHSSYVSRSRSRSRSRSFGDRSRSISPDVAYSRRSPRSASRSPSRMGDWLCHLFCIHVSVLFPGFLPSQHGVTENDFFQNSPNLMPFFPDFCNGARGTHSGFVSYPNLFVKVAFFLARSGSCRGVLGLDLRNLMGSSVHACNSFG